MSGDEQTTRIVAFEKAIQKILDVLETNIPDIIWYGNYGDYGIQMKDYLQEMGKTLLKELRQNAEDEIHILIQEKNVNRVLRDIDYKVERNNQIKSIYEEFGDPNKNEEAIIKLRILYKKRLIKQLEKRKQKLEDEIQSLNQSLETESNTIQECYTQIHQMNSQIDLSGLNSKDEELLNDLKNVFPTH
ncbi:hypothetical protein WA158_000147 [Blastocystis sp. Blastoise]